MKKIFSLLTVLSVLLIYSNAQNTSPYWSLAGNSNATSSSKLGTTNTVNLRFFTKNLERLRVDTSGRVGIGTITPDSRLHINSSDRQNALRAQVNGSTKFLVNSNGGAAIGSGSTPPANGLYVSGNVGIGITAPTYKLHVIGAANGIYGSGSSYGVYGISSSSGYGVYGTSSTGYGVVGSSGYIGTYGSGSSYGLYGIGGTYGAYGSGTSYGVYGKTSSGYGTAGVSSSGYGLYGSSSSNWGSVAYGVYGAYGSGTSGYGVEGISSSNWGVYGYSTSSYGGNFYSVNSYGMRAGTGISSGYYAGVFDGSIYTFGTYQPSDASLKKNVQEFPDAMTIINKLRPVNYEYKSDGNFASLHLPKGNHYRLIAQELEKVLPNLVKEAPPLFANKNTDNAIKPSPGGKPGSANEIQNAKNSTTETITSKAVNYTELIPIMIKAMQEQDAKITEQQTQNEELQNRVRELKSLVQSLSEQMHITAGITTAFLKQNAPNPSNNNTVIGYYIPSDVSNAQIKITDIKGRVIKAFNASKGEGQLNIKNGELPAGTYNYTLYINNKTVDTKQMILMR